MAPNQTSATVTPIAAAVTAAVTAAAVQTNPEWAAWGAADAESTLSIVSRVALYRVALENQPYPVWALFGTSYKAGATSKGYSAPDKLLERCVYAPLKEHYNIVKPKSENSHGDGTKKSEEAQALAAMSVKEIKAEIAANPAPARLAKLYPALVAREKADNSAALKKTREKLAKKVTMIREHVKTMQDDETAVNAMVNAIGKIHAEFAKRAK